MAVRAYRRAMSNYMYMVDQRSSWIRQMFDAGIALKRKIGAANVFDQSLGNPDIKPSPEIIRAGIALLQAELDPKNAHLPNQHAYMANIGYEDQRGLVADYLNRTQNPTEQVTPDHIVWTCGAGAALNVALKALCDKGDNVVTHDPFFVEYLFYTANHDLTLRTAPTTENFDLDPVAFDRMIGPRTRAVILNTPGNPTGKLFSTDALRETANVLKHKERKHRQDIYVLFDQPYAGLVFGGKQMPSIFDIFPHSLLIYSFSKDLSFAGERIGYIGVNPSNRDTDGIMGALKTANRILGFVNAPAFMQRWSAQFLGTVVGLEEYEARSQAMYRGLTSMGYELEKPDGTFYLWLKVPGGNDVKFAKRAREDENILVVPGRGFSHPAKGFSKRGNGYVRLALCEPQEKLEKSLPGYNRLLAA